LGQSVGVVANCTDEEDDDAAAETNNEWRGQRLDASDRIAVDESSPNSHQTVRQPHTRTFDPPGALTPETYSFIYTALSNFIHQRVIEKKKQNKQTKNNIQQTPE